jgi:hypothetical protein
VPARAQAGQAGVEAGSSAELVPGGTVSPVGEDAFRRFYKELLTMMREGVPPPRIVQKIRRTIPDPESRRPLLGHLRDSRDALEAEGEESAAATLDRIIERLEGAGDE